MMIALAHPQLSDAIADGAEEVRVGATTMNPRLHLAIHEIVAQQLVDGDPPEAIETAQRLLAIGRDQHEVLHMLGSTVSAHLWNALHDQRPYGRAEHVAALAALPGSWDRQAARARSRPQPRSHRRRRRRGTDAVSQRSCMRRTAPRAVPPARGWIAAHGTVAVALSGRRADVLTMNDAQLLEDVRRLRAAGAAPKEIARALGMRSAVIAPLVRQLAEEEQGRDPAGMGELAGCWVSPGWSRELLVAFRDEWEDVDLGEDGPAGIALALVARSGRGDRITVCGYLVDTFCLGVKNAIGPEHMRERDLPGFVRMYFQAFPAPPLRAPIELARHLVLGAVEFAAGLGFAPHPDFEAVREQLGELDEPCALTFGREGRPLYVAGPYDDSIAIMETLRATIGSDGFSVAA
jgi:hypothetical protein